MKLRETVLWVGSAGLLACSNGSGETTGPSSSTTQAASTTAASAGIQSSVHGSMSTSSDAAASTSSVATTQTADLPPHSTSTVASTDESETMGDWTSAPESAVSTADTGGEPNTAVVSSVSASADSTSTSEDVSTEPLRATTVYIAGDSTVASYRDTESSTDQAGWGQMLHEYLDPLATVDNRAVGGTTSRSFIDFGHFATLEADLGDGDTLLVQFGTNDGNKTATYELNGQEVPYYLDPATDFKTYLSRYIDVAEAKGAWLVFVTPPPRNSAYCTGGNGTGGHAQAMREVGTERGIPVVDLNQRSVDHLKAICPAPAPEDVFLLRADGTVDGTHFQENGARLLARLVADELANLPTPLARYVVSPRETRP